MKQIFSRADCDLWVKTYEILATGHECGLVEACVDSASIHSIKEKMGAKSTIFDFYKMQFGPDVKSKKYK